MKTVQYVELFPGAAVPKRASAGAVGFDVYSNRIIDKNTREECSTFPYTLFPGESVLMGTGIALAVPFPIDCQIRPRSGLASKFDIELSNSPGTIDPDFRGEAGILLRNRGKDAFTFEKGMRIAQLLFTKVEIPHFQKVDQLPSTSRGSGGFGSTGLGLLSIGDSEYLHEQERWDRFFMGMAVSASRLSNCLRGAERDAQDVYRKDEKGMYCGASRRFGCLVVKDGNIIAYGFNTRTSDCTEERGCIREREGIPTGVSNEKGCGHAEIVMIQNFCRTGGAAIEGATVYVNAEPCEMCAKVLMGCGIASVVVPHNVYPTNGLRFFLDAHIQIRRIDMNRL